MSRLQTAASQAGGLAGTLSSRGSEVASAANIPAGMWSGADADAAGGLLSPQANPLWDASDAFTSGQRILEELTESLDKAKSLLDDAHAAVAGTPAYITGNGDVVVPPGLDAADHQRAVRAAKSARDIIDDALTSADNADNTASGALGASAAYPWNHPVFTNEDSPLNPQFWQGVGQAGQDWASDVIDGIIDNTKVSGPGITVNDQGGWDFKAFGVENELKGTHGPFYAKGGVDAGVGGSLGPMTSVEAGVGASVGAGVEGELEGDGVKVTGNAGVEAGARAGIGFDFGVEDGKFHAGGHAKASAGVGGSLGAGLEVDLDDLRNDWNDFSKDLLTPPPNAPPGSGFGGTT